jgi:hypothetical protein
MTQSRWVRDVPWPGEGTRGRAGGRRRPCGRYSLQRGRRPERGTGRGRGDGSTGRTLEHVDDASHDRGEDDDDGSPDDRAEANDDYDPADERGDDDHDAAHD